MFLSAADEAFMHPAVNYALLSFSLGAVGYLGFDPRVFKQATTCPDAPKWWTAMDAEMSGLDRFSAFTWVLLSAVPAGVRIVSCKWVYKIKPEKYKARIVVRGDQQDLQVDDKVATYSPALKSITLRLLLALASYLGWSLWQMDVCNAFLPDDTPVYMDALKGYERPEQVICLRKALYGLKQSPRQWFDTLKAFLCSAPLSLRQCPVDACLFMLVVRDDVVLLVGIHVDDLVIVCVDSHLQWLRAALLSEFGMEDIGRPTCVLGMDTDLRSDGSIHLFQCSYMWLSL